MGGALPQPLLADRLDVHDRKQFELKLEYQPSGEDPDSEYELDAFIFVPASLNISADTWPRDDFYADLHNYVRLKTPTLSFDELLRSELSPLAQLEQCLVIGLTGPETELVYDAKMLSCIFRGALRRFAKGVRERCITNSGKPVTALPHADDELDQLAESSVKAVREILRRYRAAVKALEAKLPLDERTGKSLRLVDEYLSLAVEQFFRKTVVQMDEMPRSGVYSELRRDLMTVVIEEEAYRREINLKSIISPTGDNEEYTHRVGLLKKFCMNILFLRVQRSANRKNWEEAMFATAAGLSMAFAVAVAIVAQARFSQASLNFALIAVIGYMFKDRIKDAARRVLQQYMSRFLPDRTTRIVDPTTREEVGVCREKVEYGPAVAVPEEIVQLRRLDDIVTATQGETSETIIRYQKKIVLDSEMLPRLGDGFATGVTDIIRLNVDRMTRDMDDPEAALEYVDLEDFHVDKVRAAKTYQVDLAFRFKVDDGHHRTSKYQLVRLVMDRNGIKRMLRFDTHPAAVPVLSAIA